MKTRGLAEVCSDTFPVEMASSMFLSQCRDTKATFHLFYKITKVVFEFSLSHPLLSILKENEACPFGACVGRVLLYKTNRKYLGVCLKIIET